MIKRLDEDTSLKLKSLPAEEKAKKGILGRLYGPVASFSASTRNGRKYSQELWEKLFSSDLIKERFANGGIMGELTHPEDREEIALDRVAVIMPEPPVKDNKGQLIGYVDILDTPCGRIAYQLAKYGYKFGISSRGTGDIIEGYDGDEVDPDTYQLNAFDLVEIPAVESARLQFVESLNTTKKYGKTLKESLDKVIGKASNEDKKIMLEALDELGFDMEDEDYYDTSGYGPGEESDFETWGEHDDEYFNTSEAPTEDDSITESKGNYIGIDDIDEGSYPYLYDALDSNLVSLIVYDDTLTNEQFDETGMEEADIDPLAVKDDISRLAEHMGLDFQFDNNYSESVSEELELNSKDHKDQKHYDDSFYDIDTNVNNLLMEIGEDPNFGPDSETYKVLQNISTTLGKNAKLIDEKLDWFNEDYDDALDKISLKWARNKLAKEESLDEAFDPSGYTKVMQAINDGIETDEDEEALTDYLAKIIGYCKSIADDYDLYIPALDDMYESCKGSDINEVVNDKSNEDGIVAEFQEALKKATQLEADNLSLQEKLSVCSAKEVELEEQLAKYKTATVKLSESVKNLKGLNKSLNEKDKVIAENKRIMKNLSQSELSANMRLGSVTKELDECKENNKALTKKLDEVSAKLTKSEELVGKYKNSYSALKESYLDLKVSNYGLKKDEVKQKLGESYKIKDIDAVCEELSMVKINMGKLPFRINEDVKVSVRSAATSKKLTDDDYVSDSLRSMIN